MAMKHNKYLEDLGLKIDRIETNFCDDENDERANKWKEQRETYGFDSRECFDLRYTFAQWLYSHLMMYREDAMSFVDLSFNKFNYNGNMCTQEELIDKMLVLLRDGLRKEAMYEDGEEIEEATKIFSLILPSMWW